MTKQSFVIVALVSLFACDGDRRAPYTADSQTVHVNEVVAAGGVVDSILPIETHLDRFRATVADSPRELRTASSSIDSLVERWVLAVSGMDTAALNAIVIDRAEFAWLYYPTSVLAKPPYEAPPELLWGQILAASNEGARKSLEHLGGKRITVDSIMCPAATIEGGNRLYSGCSLNLRVDGQRLQHTQWFGTVIERNGMFKFIGLSNRL